MSIDLLKMFEELFNPRPIIARLPIEVQLMAGVKLTPEQLEKIGPEKMARIKEKIKLSWGVEGCEPKARPSRRGVPTKAKPKATDLCKNYIDSLPEGQADPIPIKELAEVTKYTHKTIAEAMKELGYFYVRPRNSPEFFTKVANLSRAARYKLILSTIVDVLENKGVPSTKKLIVHELIKLKVISDEKVQRQSVYNALIRLKQKGVITTCEANYSILTVSRAKFLLI